MKGGMMSVESLPDIIQQLSGRISSKVFFSRESFGNYAWRVGSGGLELLAVDPRDEGESPDLDWGPDASPKARERVARILYDQVVSSRYDTDFDMKIDHMMDMIKTLPEEAQRDQKARIRHLTDCPRAFWERKMHDLMVAAIADSIINNRHEDRWSIELNELVNWILGEGRVTEDDAGQS